MNLYKLAAMTAPLLAPGFNYPSVNAQTTPGLPGIAGTANRGSTFTSLSAIPLPSSEVIPVVGVPSMVIYQNPQTGGTIIRLTRITKFGEILTTQDAAPMKAVGEIVLQQLIAMSQGPLTSKILAKRGHPYGRNAAGVMRGNVGIGRSIKGIRGVVPPINVINISGNKTTSGNLARGWRFEQKVTGAGLAMYWMNDAPESWWVIRGTAKMVAHGPATYAPLSHLGEIDSTWRTIALRLYYRNNAQQQIYDSLGAPDVEEQSIGNAIMGLA